MSAKFAQLSLYLIGSSVPADTPFVRVAIGLAVALVVGGLIGLLLAKLSKRVTWRVLLRTLSSVSGIAGLGWLLLLFLRNQRLVPFDRRIWMYLWLIIMLGAAIIALRRYRKTKPVYVQTDLRYKQFDQYLPKPKRS